MKLWKKCLLGLVILLSSLAIYFFVQARSLSVEALSENLSVIRGIGGNATILKTSAGTVVIDSMTFPMQGGLIREKAETITGAEVVLLINTHYHLDHTHGNPGFKPGTKVLATDRTLSHLKALDADFWEGERALLLPNDTISDERTFRLGDTQLKVKHPGSAHTDGDLVVLIESEDTVVMGDMFFNQHYPNIDLEAGGSVSQWSSSIDKVLGMNFKRVIPGHGATSNRQGLQAFQAFMVELAEVGKQAKEAGKDLQQTLNDTELTSDQGYTEIAFAGIPLGLDKTFVITRAWEESTGNFDRRN